MKYLVFGLLALLVTFCDKEDEITVNDYEYLIFGHFYGHCMGEECVEIFKLTRDQLFEDTTDSYVATQFEFIPLENDKFQKVKDLINELPEELLKEEQETIGCPDCADQGGLYIEISEQGEKISWRIDQNMDSVPKYLHAFMRKVNEAITQL